MATPELVNLSALVDDAKCFAVVREHRWPQGVRCPGCDGDAVIRDGCDDTLRDCQRYRCKTCGGRFDDLTDTVLAGHHQPLRVWVLCLYVMGLTEVVKGSLVHTDEYAVYARLPAWSYRQKTVCHGCGEYARDEDGDGFGEVHVNTMKGFWSSLRPHRGISHEKLPLYLGFFQFVHNARRRGKALLGTLISALVA